MQTCYIIFILLIAEAGNRPNNFFFNQNIFMKGLIQLLLLLTPAWASARHSPEHKKRKNFICILLLLPCNAEKDCEKNMITFVIMILFVLFFSWGQQIRFYYGGILDTSKLLGT